MRNLLVRNNYLLIVSALKSAAARSPDDLSLALLILALLTVRLTLYVLVTHHIHHLYDALCRFDCGWYVITAQSGYGLHPQVGAGVLPFMNWAFFPVYPGFIKAISFVFRISYNQAGFFAANFCLCVFVFISAKYLKLIVPGTNTVALALFIFAFPYGFYFSAQYTESTYAALTMAAFYFFARGKIITSSAVAAILTATRVTGVLFTPILVFHYLKLVVDSLRVGNKAAAKAIFVSAIFPVAIAPLGLFCYMFYLYLHTGDAFAFIHIQRAWQRTEADPFPQFLRGLLQFDLDQTWVLKGGSGTFCALSALCSWLLCLRLLLKKRYAECWFLLMSTMIALSAGLVSMPRYVYANPIFVVFLFDFFWTSKYRSLFAEIIFASLALQLYLVHLWSLNYNSLI
jgi:hypothetical protein